MPVVLPTPDVEQFKAFTRGDEGALMAIFRQEYDALIARAQETLGPELAHCSPRVVENAMVSTWQRHADFSQPTGLVAGLEVAVEEEAATQRRKHAALHRHGAAPREVHIPTADEAITALDLRLHAAPPDHDALLAEARAAKRRHAQEHVQAVGRKPNWILPTVLAIVAIAAIVGVQRWVGARGGDLAVTNALAASDARDIRSARGQRGEVTLTDDSRARVGSESQVRVPKEFGGNIRTLELTGTARFQVAPGRSTPFAVRARNVDITATGTNFTVRAYPDEDGVSVMVDEGSVDVRVRDGGTAQSVAAGGAVHIGADGAVAPLDPIARDIAFAWTRDSLVMADAPLSKVVPMLVRWFDLKLRLGADSIANRRVSLRIGLQSSGAAIEAVRQAADLVTGFDDDKTMVLQAAPPPRAKR